MLNDLIKRIKGDRSDFLECCRSNDLRLKYQDNKHELGILKAVFENREYADYFPFYKKSTIIDLGAHYGYFSIFAANNTGHDSIIFAVEPNKNNFIHLEKNIRDCGISNVKCFNCAIGGANGPAKLYTGQSVNHSLIKDNPLLRKSSVFEEVWTKSLETFVTENAIEAIDFLKLDCEGAEYAILDNTPAYIYDRIRTISMEFHDLKTPEFTGEHLVRLLDQNGFKVVKYKYEKTSMNLNFGKVVGTKKFN